MNDKRTVGATGTRTSDSSLCSGSAAKIVTCIACCAAVSLLFSAFQVGFFSEARLFGAAPDLCLALTVAAGFRFGKRVGAVVGVASGFFVEALSLSGFSLLIPFYLICGFVAGFYYGSNDRVFRRLSVFYAILSVACLVKQSAAALWVLVTTASFEIGKIFVGLFLTELACTLLFSIFSYLTVAGICALLRRLQLMKL